MRWGRGVRVRGGDERGGGEVAGVGVEEGGMGYSVKQQEAYSAGLRLVDNISDVQTFVVFTQVSISPKVMKLSW